MKYLGSVFTLLFMVIIMTGCVPVGERESCVSREPVLEGGEAGYELLDLMNKEVWLTLDFTAQEYAEFSPPVLWQKNQPRVSMSDSQGGEFLRSPGCTDPGLYTYLQAWDKEFLNVVKLITIYEPVDEQGLIRETTLEKYHVLTYAAGSTVYVLHNPDGERFIGVSRDGDRTSDTFTLPDGWFLTTHVLASEIVVDLSGIVSNLRTENEDSFQGPLSEGINF